MLFPDMPERQQPVQPSREDLLARSYLQRHMGERWFAEQQCLLLQEILRVQDEQAHHLALIAGILVLRHPGLAYQAQRVSNVDSKTATQNVEEGKND